MQLSNNQVKQFGDFLYELELSGKESRMRTRLIRMIEVHLAQVQEENQMLIQECAEKNEDGSPVVNEATGLISLLPDKAEYYHQEYDDLMNEFFYIEENEQNKKMIETVNDILQNAELKISGLTAMLYDDWCDLFEETVAHYGDQLEEVQHGG